jgi:hypothetical protein
VIDLPALRADDPLGFLASLGLLALSEQGEIPNVKLSWSGRTSPIASVEGEIQNVDDLARALQEALERLQEANGVLPGVDPSFPYAGAGSTTDPMRMSRHEMRTVFERADQDWQSGNPWLGRWVVALCGHSAVKDSKRGDVELTPFYAPTGQMKMRQSIFESTMKAVGRVGGPADALTGWRRTSYDGANFDERSKRDAVFTTSGKPNNQGAPSATWLAAMSLRFFPMADGGVSTETVGWIKVKLYDGYTNRSLVWPTWEPCLDASAVRILLAHPAVRPQGTSRAELRFDGSHLRALGVTAVFGSSRRTLSQGDGPLGPAIRLWP